MSLLGDVAAHLERNEIAFALIGAAALSVHGVPRSTFDADLATVDRKTLAPAFWDPVFPDAEIRTGDFTDPLAGVIRLRRGASEIVDVVVGKYKFIRDAIERATRAVTQNVELPVVLAADLVLLKLFAGGHQDAWDISQLLTVEPGLAAEIDARIGDVTDDARALWNRIRAKRE